MVKYICDLCGKEIDNRLETLTGRTLKSVAPVEYHKVDFCEKCLQKFDEEQEKAPISVQMKFLKEMKKI